MYIFIFDRRDGHQHSFCYFRLAKCSNEAYKVFFFLTWDGSPITGASKLFKLFQNKDLKMESHITSTRIRRNIEQKSVENLDLPGMLDINRYIKYQYLFAVNGSTFLLFIRLIDRNER
jgi:hypothetical protein